MARAEADALRTLLPVLRQLREIKGVQEVRPGVFHARRDAFIHFHDDAGVLSAPTSRSRAARASTASRWRRRPSSASSSTKRSCAHAASTTTEP